MNNEIKAAEHTKLAKEALKKVDESWDRSDTDGFLTQWAGGITANLHQEKARIYRHNGFAAFTGLYEGDRRVKARIVEGKFGDSWLLDDAEAAKFGRKFIPTGSTSRIQKSLGLSQRREKDLAYATTLGKGYGLSGTAWVACLRTEKWGSDQVALITDAEYEDLTNN